MHKMSEASKRLFLGAVAMLAVGASEAHSFSIDFETFPDASPIFNGAAISDQYAAEGVIWERMGGTPTITGSIRHTGGQSAYNN